MNFDNNFREIDTQIYERHFFFFSAFKNKRPKGQNLQFKKTYFLSFKAAQNNLLIKIS